MIDSQRLEKMLDEPERTKRLRYKQKFSAAVFILYKKKTKMKVWN